MTTAKLGRFTEVPLREIWTHEAYDFSSWLFKNLDILNEQLGIELTAVETEKSVGTFSLDLMAQDRDGRTVIIENQLEKTDHDHLGKVLTYLSNLQGKTAIWISSDPRPEHVNAINYLNEVVPDDTSFYLLKVQAFKIFDSPPAPLFSVVAGPSPELKAGGKIKKDLAGKEAERFQFFEQLLERSNKAMKLFDSVSPQGYQSWISAGSGKSGVAFQYVIRNSDAKAELFIAGPDSDLIRKRFEYLYNHKTEIEQSFGGELEWDQREDRKQQYVRAWCKVGGFMNNDKWPEIQGCMVDSMKRLSDSLGPFIQKLP